MKKKPILSLNFKSWADEFHHFFSIQKIDFYLVLVGIFLFDWIFPEAILLWLVFLDFFMVFSVFQGSVLKEPFRVSSLTHKSSWEFAWLCVKSWMVLLMMSLASMVWIVVVIMLYYFTNDGGFLKDKRLLVLMGFLMVLNLLFLGYLWARFSFRNYLIFDGSIHPLQESWDKTKPFQKRVFVLSVQWFFLEIILIVVSQLLIGMLGNIIVSLSATLIWAGFYKQIR
jgi:hypothetical protein